MALAIKLDINIRPDSAEDRRIVDGWTDLISNPPKELRFIRMEGVSAAGPCEQCAQWFGVEHDGTGADGVPLIPLHDFCVCTDLIKELTDLVSGEAIHPKERGEWLMERPADEKREILGVGRANLLESGAVSLKQLYERFDSPLAAGRPLRDIARKLAGASKVKLIAAAKEAGIDDIEGMTRAELLDRIIGRKTISQIKS